jgi:hypothetical protein
VQVGPVIRKSSPGIPLLASLFAFFGEAAELAKSSRPQIAFVLGIIDVRTDAFAMYANAGFGRV